MSYKTRTNYGTGLKQCFENCKCSMCKREKQDQDRNNPTVEINTEVRASQKGNL